MNLIKGYESSESEHEHPVKKIKVDQSLINLAPTVDISALQSEKNQAKTDELEKLYPAKEKTNHLTGQADLYYMNPFNFDEQYHNFKNLGFAYDPSDGPEQKIVVNNQFSNISNEVLANRQNFISKSVFSKNKKENDDQRKIISKNRKKSGVPGSGEYLGPWAGYDNEDKYNKEVISLEQKEILNKIEEKRQKKIEEQKTSPQEVKYFFFNFQCFLFESIIVSI